MSNFGLEELLKVASLYSSLGFEVHQNQMWSKQKMKRRMRRTSFLIVLNQNLDDR